MVKFLVASSMIAVLTVSMFVMAESAGFDMMQAGKDIMKVASAAMETKFKPEDIKEVMAAMSTPAEQKAMMEVITMMMQNKPMDDIIEKLMETESGPIMADALMPVVSASMEMKQKYGKGLEGVAAKKGD